MPRFAVLHAADLRLDAPFEGIGRTPAHVAAGLRDASLGAWQGMIDLAIAHEVAAVLLAGGLCGGLEHGVRAQAHLRDGLARLIGENISVFIALGERDPLDGFAAITEWPAGVTVFPAGTPSAAPLRRAGEHLATVHGVSATARLHDVAPSRFMRGDQPGPHLAVLHARLAGHGADDGTYPVSRLGDLRAAGMDYWALGHAHTLEYLATGAPWIVYPGTPQGRGLTAAECGPKGVALIEIDDGAIARVDFEPVDRVRCLHVELPDAPRSSELADALTAHAATLRGRHPGRALVLDGWFGGSAEATGALRHPDARDALLRTLRRAAEAWEPFVWWAGVHPVLPERPGDAGGNDLAAEVERRRAALAEDGAQCARFLARRFEPLRDAWTADIDPRDARELLDEAAALAVATLREDGP
jgi:hypothetical protein